MQMQLLIVGPRDWLAVTASRVFERCSSSSTEVRFPGIIWVSAVLVQGIITVLVADRRQRVFGLRRFLELPLAAAIVALCV